ncbi:universal stress protein [Desulfosporosinus acidiphilus]|uniref:universal stress protein n=1 Tax=Desulfosporosinus acidiphilus TaxID=885581 RepID=UPI0031F44023
MLTPEQIKKTGELVFEATLNDQKIANIHLIKKQTSGSPAKAILDEMKREFDLVVMGTRGHGVLTGTIIGSVTQRVLAHSHCPVLIINYRD